MKDCSFEGSSTFKMVYIWKCFWEAELQPGAYGHLGTSEGCSRRRGWGSSSGNTFTSNSGLKPNKAQHSQNEDLSKTPLGFVCSAGADGTEASGPAACRQDGARGAAAAALRGTAAGQVLCCSLLPASPSPKHTCKPPWPLSCILVPVRDVFPLVLYKPNEPDGSSWRRACPCSPLPP